VERSEYFVLINAVITKEYAVMVNGAGINWYDRISDAISEVSYKQMLL
jgi:hypothetical protein